MGRALLIFTAFAAVVSAPAHARVTTVEEWVEVEEAAPATAERFVSGVPLEAVDGIATYGPFRVIDGQRAALVGITDHRSPAQFAAMLHDYPGIASLEMIECPGTFDDIANLKVGRMIRQAGIGTHVPKGGSVRSGAVELFISGSQRSIDEGARFAVHAWEDDTGHQANDYTPSAPENRKYLTFYREMGMSPAEAEAFYAMTNSAPFENARWLSAQDIRSWVQFGQVRAPSLAPLASEITAAAAPRLAFLSLDLDSGSTVN